MASPPVSGGRPSVGDPIMCDLQVGLLRHRSVGDCERVERPDSSGGSGCRPTSLPAAARARSGRSCSRRDLDGLLDEALLLTTELSTNGVVHAGTELDVEIIADRRLAHGHCHRLRRRAPS